MMKFLLKSKNSRSRAFSLLELVVSMGILMLMSTTGVIGYATIMNVKASVQTETILRETQEAYLQYYLDTGSHPTTLADFSGYASSPGIIRDGWGRSLTLISDVTVDLGFGSEHFDAAIISSGKDDVVDSSYDSSTGDLTVSDKDILIFVDVAGLDSNKRLLARAELQLLIDAALQYYSDTLGNFPSAVSDIASEAGLTRVDSGVYVDPWNSPYEIQTGASATGGYFEILSAGIDHDISQTADNLSEYLTKLQLSRTPYEVTRESLSKANEALVTYQNAGTNPTGGVPSECVDGSTTCAAALCSDFLDGKDAVDYWGMPFIYGDATRTFYSSGADTDATTIADNIQI